MPALWGTTGGRPDRGRSDLPVLRKAILCGEEHPTLWRSTLCKSGSKRTTDILFRTTETKAKTHLLVGNRLAVLFPDPTYDPYAPKQKAACGSAVCHHRPGVDCLSAAGSALSIRSSEVSGTSSRIYCDYRNFNTETDNAAYAETDR